MRHVDEYRDPTAVRTVTHQIAETVTRPWTLMEVCGGQTHSILKFGLDELLPSTVNLVHGPGCPVCVTPLTLIDRAFETFDLMREWDPSYQWNYMLSALTYWHRGEEGDLDLARTRQTPGGTR